MVDSICRNQKWSNFVRSMKLMHGWLPNMHNLGKQTHITQCPGCECQDETFLHLFQCSHHLMKKALYDAIEKITDMCKSMHINSSFSRSYITCITCGILRDHAPVPASPHELATAIKHQNQIGTHKMLQGFLASSRGAALKATGHKKHMHTLKRLHVILYEQLFQRLWDTRNYILKKTPNQYNKAECALADRLIWYRENRHNLLSESDRHLANIDEEAIQQMGCETKCKWIRHLDHLHTIHVKENTKRDECQPAITEHFEVLEGKQSSRKAGTRKPSTCRRLPKNTFIQLQRANGVDHLIDQPTLSPQRGNRGSKLSYCSRREQQNHSNAIDQDLLSWNRTETNNLSA